MRESETIGMSQRTMGKEQWEENNGKRTMEQLSIVLRLCKAVQGCTRLCMGCAWAVQGCARLCKAVQGCERLCKSFLSYKLVILLIFMSSLTVLLTFGNECEGTCGCGCKVLRNLMNVRENGIHVTSNQLRA